MEKYIKIILKKYNGKILRGDISFSKDSDIDIFINNIKYKKNILNEFLKYNFFIIKNDNSKLTLGKFNNSKINIIDIEFNFQYVFNYFNNKIKFNNKFINDYINNPIDKNNSIIFNSIRYLFMFRNKSKYINYLNNNKPTIDILLRGLNKNLFKKNLDKNYIIDYNKFVKKDFFYLFKILKFKYFINILLGTLKAYFNSFNNGNIITINGIDGSGKTTISNILVKEFGFKYLYGGSNNYIFSNLYSNVFFKKYFIGKVIYIIFLYIENWIKYYKAFILKLKGYNVIFDRYPKINNVPLKINNSGQFINKILYGILFPSGNINIFLEVSPEKILSRKKERTEKEILEYNNQIIIYKNKKNNFFLKNNDNLDNILNKIINIILSKK